MGLEQLKAQAYDCMAQIEYWTKKLQDVNVAIRTEAEKPRETVKIDGPTPWKQGDLEEMVEESKKEE